MSVWDSAEYRARVHGEPTAHIQVVNGELMQEYILRYNGSNDARVWVSLGSFVEKEKTDG